MGNRRTERHFGFHPSLFAKMPPGKPFKSRAGPRYKPSTAFERLAAKVERRHAKKRRASRQDASDSARNSHATSRFRDAARAAQADTDEAADQAAFDAPDAAPVAPAAQMSLWQPAPKLKKRVVRQTMVADPAKIRERYGISFQLSNQAQKDNRIMDGYTGSGMYMGGRGAYRSRRRAHTRSNTLRRLINHPRYRRMAGRGGYMGQLWGASQGARMAAGSWLRSQDSPWAKAAGYGAQALGIGAYTVSNSLVNGGGGDVVPSFAPAGDDGIVVSSKEFVTDIYAPSVAGAFQNTTWDLNPGIARSFPWLSQVACNYEEYEFEQLIFTYKSNVTDFVASNGQVGTCLTATQYNANDLPFSSKTEMMHYEGAVDSKTTDNVVSGVECDPTKNSGAPGKYVRAGPPIPGQDLKTYDLGVFNLAVSNAPASFANQALGELWVSYTVRLRKKKFFSIEGLSMARDVFVGHAPTLGVGAPIGASFVTGTGQQNRIGGLLVRSGRSYIYTFPAGTAGTFKITAHVIDTTVGEYSNLAIGAGSSITAVPDMFVNTSWSSYITSGTEALSNSAAAELHVNVQTPTSAGSTVPNTIVFTVADAASAPSPSVISFELNVETYNNGFNYSQAPTGNQQLIVQNATTGIVEQWP